MLMYLVPALPILGDLSILLSFFQYRRPFHQRPPENHPKPSKESLEHLMQWYTEAWRNYLWNGDRNLYLLSHRAASTLLGRDNRVLIHRVIEMWNTNKTMATLAKCYRLDRFVAIVDGRTTWELYRRERTKKQEKLWADLWEAWFGGLFWNGVGGG